MQANLLQNLFNPVAPQAQAGGQGKSVIPAGQGSDEFASILNSTKSLSPKSAGVNELLQLIESSPNLTRLVEQFVGNKDANPQVLALENIVSKQMLQNNPKGVAPQVSAIMNAEEQSAQKLLEAFQNNDQVVQLLKSTPKLADQLNLQVVEKNVVSKMSAEKGPLQMLKRVETVQLKEGTNPTQVKEKVLNIIANNGKVVSAQEVTQGRTAQPMVGTQSIDVQSMGQQVVRPNVSRGIAGVYGKQQQVAENNIIKFDRAKSSDAHVAKDIFVTNENVDVIPAAAQQVFVPQVGEASLSTNAPQVLDLSQLQTNDTTELINKISDYIKQTQLQNSNTLELVVKHNELGQFRINVERAHGAEQLNLQIASASKEGHEFFKMNELNLSRTLASAGINVGELKLVAEGNRAENSSRDFSQQHGQNSSNQTFGENDQNQQQRDSSRRQRLWEEYKERFVA